MTKLQIQRAEERLDQIIHQRMAKWESLNPLESGNLERWQKLKLAVNDPAWRIAVVERAKRGGKWSCDDQLMDCSKVVAAEVSRRDKLVREWNQKRSATLSAMKAEARTLMDRAIIGGMSQQDLLQALEGF